MTAQSADACREWPDVWACWTRWKGQPASRRVELNVELELKTAQCTENMYYSCRRPIQRHLREDNKEQSLPSPRLQIKVRAPTLLQEQTRPSWNCRNCTFSDAGPL